MDAAEILKLPQMAIFLSQPEVEEGLKVSSEHRYCHEYQAVMEQLHMVMVDAAKAIRAHAETCTTPYICDAPCCFDKV